MSKPEVGIEKHIIYLYTRKTKKKRIKPQNNLKWATEKLVKNSKTKKIKNEQL